AVLEDMVVTAQEHDTTTLFLGPRMLCTPVSTVDIIAGTIPVPDRGAFNLMVQRELELEQSSVAQRALALACIDRRAARHQLHLRVVREVGLPDTATEVLQNAHFYYPSPTRNAHDPNPPETRRSFGHHRHCQSPPSSSQIPTAGLPLHFPIHLSQRSQGHFPRVGGSGGVDSGVSGCGPSPGRGGGISGGGDNSVCDEDGADCCGSVDNRGDRACAGAASRTETGSDSMLSDMMPDIAMATPSVGQLNLHDEMQLDIGDGGSHSSRGSRGSRHNALYI
ncbi:hypothetical protein BaRGS_00028370, partial [Batillaria attramentaria]